MTTKIAINGFGRIGRTVFRAWLKNYRNQGLEITHINDLTDIQTLAHLLKYDSVHGTLPVELSVGKDYITVDSKKITFSAERDPSKLPWKEKAIDVIHECTGIFRSKEQATKHITAGARKVLISAPAKDEDITVVMGVNHRALDKTKHHIISNGSCTTNCLAPIAKVIHENLSIKHGVMTTVHSYTNDQKILDLPHTDLRRARAAGVSMIPTTTGAAKAISLVLPDLKGKIEGMAIRVPTPNVSVVDVTFQTEKATSKKDVLSMLKDASKGELSGVLAISEEPLVSCDFNGNPYSSIVDADSTIVVGKNLIKILSWYDNETGFSYRMLDVTKLL